MHRILYFFWVGGGSLTERQLLEDRGVGGMLILKSVLEKWNRGHGAE